MDLKTSIWMRKILNYLTKGQSINSDHETNINDDDDTDEEDELEIPAFLRRQKN